MRTSSARWSSSGAQNGKIVRLEDVARVELGAETYRSSLCFDGHVAVGLGIFQQDSSNSLEIRDAVVAELARLSQGLPPRAGLQAGLRHHAQVRESMKEVTTTLLAAIVLVILVIFLFLHGWRAVTITGADAAGVSARHVRFRLAVRPLDQHVDPVRADPGAGLVVDDAIVVLENIERNRVERGLDIGAATRAAMRQVTGAVLATSIVLAAVFVPVALFPGIMGIIYRQFALTIAAAIALSMFCALTLTPALAALLLHGGRESGKWPCFAVSIARSPGSAIGTSRAAALPPAPRADRGRVPGCMAATLYLYRATPTGFIPDEDQALVMIVVRAPEGMPLASSRR